MGLRIPDMGWSGRQGSGIYFSTLTMEGLQGDIPSRFKRHCRRRWVCSEGWVWQQILRRSRLWRALRFLYGDSKAKRHTNRGRRGRG